MKSFNLLSREEIHSITKRVNFEKFARKRVVITGASGLVGGYLAYALIKCTAFLGNDAPKVIAVSKSGNFPNLQEIEEASKITFLSLDLEKDDFNFEYEILIHGASAASPTIKISKEAIFNVNCNILKKLLNNPGNVEKILFISAGEVYGSEAPTKVAENFIGKLDTSTYRANYPKAKLAGEKLASSLNDLGIAARVARLFHSFGPGLRIDDGRSFADFLWSASFGKPPVLRTPGTQIRSFLYLEDSIVGLLKVLDSDICTPINVGSENDLTILQFASRVSLIAGMGGEVIFQLNKSETVYSPNRIILPSNELLRSTGWSQQVDIDLGIERTIHWIRNSGAVKA